MRSYSSVSFYTKGKLVKEINFPNGDVCCANCPYCRQKTVNRRTRTLCTETYEPIENLSDTGRDCPLKFEWK